MSEYPLTKQDVRECLSAQIARGSNYAMGTAGAIKGWRQMQRDIAQMRVDLCRTDAIGRLSKSDSNVFDLVVLEYRNAGKVGPEWNGFLTIRA